MSDRPENDQDVVEALRAALNTEAAEVAEARDGAAAGLAAARRKALARGRARSAARPWALGFGGLATVAAGVLGLVVWLGGPHGAVAPGPVPPTEDLELLASGEGVEFYADLDFYLWLAEDGGAG